MGHLERVTRKLLRYVFKFTIALMAAVQLKILIFEQCEIHEQLKKRETSWPHELKSVYRTVLNEK